MSTQTVAHHYPHTLSWEGICNHLLNLRAKRDFSYCRAAKIASMNSFSTTDSILGVENWRYCRSVLMVSGRGRRA